MNLYVYSPLQIKAVLQISKERLSPLLSQSLGHTAVRQGVSPAMLSPEKLYHSHLLHLLAEIQWYTPSLCPNRRLGWYPPFTPVRKQDRNRYSITEQTGKCVSFSPAIFALRHHLPYKMSHNLEKYGQIPPSVYFADKEKWWFRQETQIL